MAQKEPVEQARINDAFLPISLFAYPDLDLEHVRQITGNTDEALVWRLFDQPTRRVKAQMEAGGQKDLHGFGKAEHVR